MRLDEVERVRQLAMLRRIGTGGGAVFTGELEPSEASREAYRCMQWDRGARATGHDDAAVEYLERACAAASHA